LLREIFEGAKEAACNAGEAVTGSATQAKDATQVWLVYVILQRQGGGGNTPEKYMCYILYIMLGCYVMLTILTFLQGATQGYYDAGKAKADEAAKVIEALCFALTTLANVWKIVDVLEQKPNPTCFLKSVQRWWTLFSLAK